MKSLAPGVVALIKVRRARSPKRARSWPSGSGEGPSSIQAATPARVRAKASRAAVSWRFFFPVATRDGGFEAILGAGGEDGLGDTGEDADEVGAVGGAGGGRADGGAGHDAAKRGEGEGEEEAQGGFHGF
jgi:hypothetical protein